ncbi:MAG: hypothetical protein Q9159_000034 [Coniocarpon cinnabarinum]
MDPRFVGRIAKSHVSSLRPDGFANENMKSAEVWLNPQLWRQFMLKWPQEMHTFKGRRLQLACLLDLAALLPALANGAEDVTKTGSALHRLPIVTQDPLTTSSDHNILKELNVRVVHDPEAWSLVEQSTLVFA